MKFIKKYIFQKQFIENLEWKYDNLKCCGNCKFKKFDNNYILRCDIVSNLPMNPEWVCQSWKNDFRMKTERMI